MTQNDALIQILEDLQAPYTKTEDRLIDFLFARKPVIIPCEGTFPPRAFKDVLRSEDDPVLGWIVFEYFAIPHAVFRRNDALVCVTTSAYSHIAFIADEHMKKHPSGWPRRYHRRVLPFARWDPIVVEAAEQALLEVRTRGHMLGGVPPALRGYLHEGPLEGAVGTILLREDS